jgi:hypothetical protein
LLGGEPSDGSMDPRGGAGGGEVDMQIASGIHRIGDHSIINAYLIEEANEVTVVDAGIAGLYRDLPRSSRRWVDRSRTCAPWS